MSITSPFHCFEYFCLQDSLSCTFKTIRLLYSISQDQLIQEGFLKMFPYTMARATLSGVIGPVLTDIHKSSVFAAFFFFLVSDLAVVVASSRQQQQQLA